MAKSHQTSLALYADLFDDVDPHDLSARPPNHARFTLTRATRLHSDWERAAGDTVACYVPKPDASQRAASSTSSSGSSPPAASASAPCGPPMTSAGTPPAPSASSTTSQATSPWPTKACTSLPTRQTLITFTAAPGSPTAQAPQFLTSWAAALTTWLHPIGKSSAGT
jgi:hypothetical protein